MHIFAVLKMELELSSVKTVYIMSSISLFDEHKKIPQGISQNKQSAASISSGTHVPM